MQGGVIRKPGAWHDHKKCWLLAVEDPQEVGKDIGCGSFNIKQVWAPQSTQCLHACNTMHFALLTQ